MKRKLNSQRGASITFALLLFLVCAVISSVVIVAGTTAAGRMSDLAKMDQRYYAVTSAAGLLRDVLDGQSVVITKTQETQTLVSTLTGRGAPALSEPEVAPDPSQTVFPLFYDTACILAGLDETQYTPKYNAQKLTLSATISDSDLDASGLSVNIVPQVQSNSIVLNVSSANAESNAFVLRVEFKADITETKNELIEDGEMMPGETDEEFIYNEKKTETTITTVTWQCTGIETSYGNRTMMGG